MVDRARQCEKQSAFWKEMAEQVANERVVEGLGVSPGIVIGSAYV